MSPEDALHQLKEVHQKLMSLKWPDVSFLTVIPYELMPVIADCEPLRKEYKLRVKQWQQNLQLERRSKELWRSRYLWAFGDLHMFCTEQKKRLVPTLDERLYMVHQRSWDAVCQSLVAFLAHSMALAGSNLKGRPPMAKFLAEGDELHGHILWNGKIANIARNSHMYALCKIMLKKEMRQHNEREWREIYEELYGIPPEKEDKWRCIDKIVRRINLAAREAGFGPVLQYSGGKRGTVQRLM